MHEYVQKSTRTTLPGSWCMVSGELFSQSEMPVNSGAWGPPLLSRLDVGLGRTVALACRSPYTPAATRTMAAATAIERIALVRNRPALRAPLMLLQG